MPLLRPLPATLAAVAASFALAYAFPPGTLLGWATWVLPGLVLGLLVTISVHELGHVLAGLAVGERLELLGVGPVLVWRTPHGLRVAINEQWELAAVAATAPPEPADSRVRAAVPILGGPVANLVLALGAGVFFLRLGSGGMSVSAAAGDELPLLELVLHACVFQSGFQSAIAAVANLAPGQARGLMTDGALLRLVLRDPEARARRDAYTRLIACSAAGVRPRDWDPALLAYAAQPLDGDPVAEALGHAFAYYWCMDRGDPDRAGPHLESAVAAVRDVPLLRSGLSAELAFFRAYAQADTDGARELLDRTPDDPLNRDTRLRAKAALLLAEGRYPDARATAAEAERVMQFAWGGSAGMGVLEREWLAEISERARLGMESVRGERHAQPPLAEG